MGLTIREKRIKKGWTQEYVAQQICAAVSTVQKIECGIRKPSFEIIMKLEELFQTDYRELFNLPELRVQEKQEKPDGNRAEESHKNNSTKIDKSI